MAGFRIFKVQLETFLWGPWFKTKVSMVKWQTFKMFIYKVHVNKWTNGSKYTYILVKFFLSYLCVCVWGGFSKWVMFGCPDKLYMHKSESVQENEMHKILWDFEIQPNQQIPARRSDLVWIIKKKRTCHLVDFCRFGRPYSKNKQF